MFPRAEAMRPQGYSGSEVGTVVLSMDTGVVMGGQDPCRDQLIRIIEVKILSFNPQDNRNSLKGYKPYGDNHQHIQKNMMKVA